MKLVQKPIVVIYAAIFLRRPSCNGHFDFLHPKFGRNNSCPMAEETKGGSSMIGTGAWLTDTHDCLISCV